MSDGAHAMSTNSVAATSNPVELALEAARQGATDASEAAGRFAESAGLFLTRFVYTTCYTISYGVVFPTMLVARSLPRESAMVRGLVDGAGAATRKVEAIVERS